VLRDPIRSHKRVPSAAGHEEAALKLLPVAQEDEGIETWMLLEYCDRGSLQRAIERGKLTSRGPEGGADMVWSPPAQNPECY